ncbi:MAG: tetratricopeptide repeat protein [Xenococcaceae cyanobacterium]
MLRRIRQSWRGSQNLAVDRDYQNSEHNFEFSSQFSSPENSNGKLLPTQSLSKQLSDGDYEFLFDQLLEGVANSWHEGRIVKFFNKLDTRGQPELWLDWLQRFSHKVLAMPVPDRELAARLLLFGQIVQSSPELEQIGLLAYEIGHQLITKHIGESRTKTNSDRHSVANEETVWEYAEAEEASPLPAPTPTPIAEIEGEEVVWEYVGVDREPSLPETTSIATTEIESSDSFWDDAPAQPENSVKPNLSEVSELALTDESAVVSETSISHTEQSLSASPIITDRDSTEREQFPDLSSETIELTKEDLQNITPEQFIWILRQDTNLVAQMSAQLGITTNDPQVIVQALLESLNTNEEQTEAQKQLELAESWFELGLKQANLGNMEEAIASWDKALELDEHLSVAWHNRGSALGHLAKFTEAIASFDRALKINSDDAQTWNDRAHALLKLKKWDEALDSWERAIAIHPNFYQFWYNRGYVLEKLGRAEESIASYEKALQMQPDVLPVNNGYSNLLENKTESNR